MTAAVPSQIPLLGNIARRHASERGTKVALRFEDEALSYAELERHACQIANGLVAGGIRPGDRVAYLGKNSAAYFEYLLGASKAGAVTVPINWRLAPREIAALLADCQPSWLLVAQGFETLGAEVAGNIPLHVTGGPADTFKAWRAGQSSQDPNRKAQPDEPALQLYTSGTTGKPKGAMLTHRSLFGLRAAMQSGSQPGWYGWSSDDVSLIAMPIAHISGSGWGIWTLQHGATGIVVREFNPHAVFDLMVTHRINKIIMVPTAMQIALRHPGARGTDFSFLKHIAYGGAPMPPDLLREGIEVFGCGFVQMYGMTEMAGTIVALPPEDHDIRGGPRMGSVGVALPGVELKIVDGEGRELPSGETGEILARGQACMSGYFNQPEATASALDDQGWLRTGDAGFLDADGYLFLRDRVKDMIITGGENVYPTEVENAIREHPGVEDVAVIGIPDAKWGEAVTAFIVPKKDAALAAPEIVSFARERIAAYKAPKSVRFTDALPRNASGKILRRELRDRFRTEPGVSPGATPSN